MPVSSYDLSVLPRSALQVMRDAGAEVLECRRVLDKSRLNVVGEILRRQSEFIKYENYPAHDVYDAAIHAQYYDHAHRGTEGEHGHFHLPARGRHARHFMLTPGCEITGETTAANIRAYVDTARECIQAPGAAALNAWREAGLPDQLD